MKQTSLFVQYVSKFFSGVVAAIVNKINDSKNPLVYYHKRFLKKQYSPDGKWESITAANTLVMADVVAMDSSLPLKKRDSISRASGDIPKMGMEMALREKQLTDLRTLALRPETEAQLITRIFNDVPRVIGGVYERNEAIFLEALSTGVAEITDTENVGTSIRLDYGYLSANQSGVATVWSSTSATPLDDLQGVWNNAKNAGNIIQKWLMDRATFNNFAKTTQVKEYYAFSVSFAGTASQIPSLSKVNEFLKDTFGFTIEIIERSVRYEKNGVQTVATPWATGIVIGICSEELGLLQWARLAEADFPVDGVTYQTADDYILVSKYRSNQPSLAEWTSSQSRVVPVLTNVDQIYKIDSTEVEG